MNQAENKKLFAEFAPVTTKEWEEQINQDLKGADYEKKLVWKTHEGFDAKPYYRSEDVDQLLKNEALPGEFPYARGSKKDNNTWQIRQDFEITEPAASNKKIKEAIKKGVTGIGIKACTKEINSQKQFSDIFSDIEINNIPLHFSVGKGTTVFIDFLINECLVRKIPVNKITGSFGFDPLGYLTTNGCFYSNESGDMNLLKETVEKCRKDLPFFRSVNVNTLVFCNAGASAVQELAFALSMGNEYLNILTSEGLSADEAALSIHFRFGIGTSYFIEIAKLRAARILWSAIVNEYNPVSKNAAKMLIHAETSAWNKTIYDPYVNILRTTTESMSAAIGGADSITVKPFDSVYNDENEFSSRIARNTQIILQKEAYFNRIADPSAGSYYIESLTNSLIENAWKLFIETEDKGGYIESFKKGFIQKQVNDTAQKRIQLIAQRREILLGTNQFPNSTEEVLKNIKKDTGHKENKESADKIAEPVVPIRGSEEYEQLRLSVEQSGIKPKAFMLTIGNLNMRKARASFSCNFFACAGYEVIDNNGFSSPEEGIKAALNAQANIVVICSSDDEYADIAPVIYDQLKNKCIVVVAGAPACTDELKAKGIEHFIHLKTNALESLRNFNTLLKINKE